MLYPNSITLTPRTGAFGEVRLPGSKSISNRMLLLAALATGTTRLRHVLQSDDTGVMIDALRALGVVIDQHHPADADANTDSACQCLGTYRAGCGR